MSLKDDFVRVGQIGTTIITTVTRVVGGVDTAVDLSATSNVKIEIQKPSGERLALFTATISNPPGTDGIVNFKDTVGIFDVAGRWKVRGIANFSNGDSFPGSWFGFGVDE